MGGICASNRDKFIVVSESPIKKETINTKNNQNIGDGDQPKQEAQVEEDFNDPDCELKKVKENKYVKPDQVLKSKLEDDKKMKTKLIHNSLSKPAKNSIGSTQVECESNLLINQMNLNEQSTVIHNLHEILGYSSEYYIVQKMSFIVLLKASAIHVTDFIKMQPGFNYKSQNTDHHFKHSSSMHNHDKQFLRSRTEGNKFISKDKKNVFDSSLQYINLSPNKNRFGFNKCSLVMSPDYDILPLLDDIEVIKINSFSDFEKKVKHLEKFYENDIYLLYYAKYEGFLEYKSPRNSNSNLLKLEEKYSSAIREYNSIIKVYRDKNNLKKNLKFLYSNYHTNYLRPDQIMYLAENAYLIYNVIGVRLYDNQSFLDSDSLIGFTRQMLIMLEFSHTSLRVGGFGISIDSVIVIENTEINDINFFLHDFTTIIEGGSNEEFLSVRNQDFYELANTMYTAIFDVPLNSE